MLFAYLKMKLKLQIAGYDVDFFSYDWRQNIVGLGKRSRRGSRPRAAKCTLSRTAWAGLSRAPFCWKSRRR